MHWLFLYCVLVLVFLGKAVVAVAIERTVFVSDCSCPVWFPAQLVFRIVLGCTVPEPTVMLLLDTTKVVVLLQLSVDPFPPLNELCPVVLLLIVMV